MVVGETGSELDVEAMPAKKSKKGGGVGSFEAKFKKAGTKPVQVWEGKYASLLKSNGWGGNGGRKWPKNWHERELATSELDRMLGRQVLVQLTAKNVQKRRRRDLRGSRRGVRMRVQDRCWRRTRRRRRRRR